jgi:uncharacterized protein (DUF1330 family)
MRPMINAFVTLTITDPDRLARYRTAAGDALAKHDGRLVTASPVVTLLEGEGIAPDMAALLEFDSREGAMAWINDPDLTQIHGDRRGSGASTILLLG